MEVVNIKDFKHEGRKRAINDKVKSVRLIQNGALANVSWAPIFFSRYLHLLL